MGTFLKKYWLTILFVVLLTEIAVFMVWASRNTDLFSLFLAKQGIEEVATHVPQQAFNDTEVATKLIGEVNSSLSQQLQSVPEKLSAVLEDTRIYFMLTNKGVNHDELLTQSYVFENGAFSAPQEKSADEGDLYYSFSPDGTTGVYTAITQAQRDANVGASVYTYTTQSISGSAFPSLAQSIMVDDSESRFKRHATISNKGVVLYSAWSRPDAPWIGPVDEWSIYYVVEGAPVLFDSGYMPKWMNDTEFAYLKNDGLYFGNIDTLRAVKIFNAENTVLNNNRIDVSDDGEKIAWIQPGKGSVFIYERGASEFEYKAEIPLKGFWAVFSPSGEYLAVQTIDADAKGDEENPNAKIEFYDMSTYTKVPELSINLDAFDQESMFMTDWSLKK